MREKRQPKIHFPFFVLSTLGTMLFALGLFEFLETGSLLPESLKFDFYPLVLMVLGLMLEVPFVIWLLKQRNPHRSR